MKRLLLPLTIILLLALAACGADTSDIGEQAGNAAATAQAVATDIADGPDGNAPTEEPTATPAEMDSWAGSVTTKDGSAAAGVTVSINGATTQSDANGSFTLQVPREEDSRYVINAEQDGYLPISQIHVGVAMETLALTLQAVVQIPIDPTQPIAEEDDHGTQISIAANQLEDADGNAPTGDVTMNMYTFDLETEEMVGDMSGTNTDGEAVAMESAGAFYASFEDDAGTEYNLADGAEAEISIPAERTNPDEVLTVWSYDEETGLWIEEGVAELEDGRYVATVTHFSYWNFDWEKREPACIKLDIEPTFLSSNAPLQVKAVLQTNPPSVRNLSVTDQVNVLVNLPTNTDVQFFIPPTSVTPFATINSSAPWGGTGVPAYPYDACKGKTEILTSGDLKGQIVEATTGNPIEGAEVCIVNTTSCTTSGTDGSYTFTALPVGQHNLKVTKAGFLTVEAQSFTIAPGQTTNDTTALSPQLAAGEVRIILTWDVVLSDLDAFLWTPSSDTPIYHRNLSIANVASLDIDNINAPQKARIETITIVQQTAGTYTYAINNVRTGEGGYDVSNARVEVYDSTGLVNTFTPPTGQSGKWWHVFDMNGANNTITAANALLSDPPKAIP